MAQIQLFAPMRSISDFFMTVWTAQIGSYIRYVSDVLPCDLDLTGHFAFHPTFMSLKYNRQHKSALEVVGPGKIHACLCKHSLLLVPSIFFCECRSLQSHSLFSLETDGGCISFRMWRATQKIVIENEDLQCELQWMPKIQDSSLSSVLHHTNMKTLDGGCDSKTVCGGEGSCH